MNRSFYFSLKKKIIINIYIFSKIHRYKDCASHLKISTNFGVNFIHEVVLCVCVRAPTGQWAALKMGGCGGCV